MNLVAIKTNKGAIISDPDNKHYPGTMFSHYLFDFTKAQKTFLEGWYSLPKMPETCQKIIPAKKELASYKLKDGFPVSAKTPAVLRGDFFTYDDDLCAFVPSEIYGLYDAVYTEIPESYVAEPLTIECVASIDNLEFLRGFDFPAIRELGWRDQPYTITEKDVTHQIIDQILFPEPLLALRPCKLTSKQSFDIIRQHIRDNINPKVAEISSNNYCLSVKKRIPRSGKDTYKTADRSCVVYECAPLLKGEVYKGYTQCPTFSGENYKDMQKNIKTYLKKIMKLINRPVRECEHCKGWGVIFTDDNTKTKTKG